MIVERAPISLGCEAMITEAGDIRFFAGWRSDPFFCDVEGAKNNLQFTGDDFFADKDVCSIVLELPNSALGAKESSSVGPHAYVHVFGGAHIDALDTGWRFERSRSGDEKNLGAAIGCGFRYGVTIFPDERLVM